MRGACTLREDYWGGDWIWGLPILVGTIVFHVSMFILIEIAVARFVTRQDVPASFGGLTFVIAVVSLAAAVLHAVEAAVWSGVFVVLGAIPDLHAAILYSLSAITAYGHAEVFLDERWRLLGAIEAMNGLFLFGITTAFLFSSIALARGGRV